MKPIEIINKYNINYIIIGFPKCGTTSLAEWLASVEGVNVSSPKETYLLCPEFYRDMTLIDSDLFSNKKSQIKIEATTLNIYSTQLLTDLLESSTKVIAVYRKPWDAVASWNNQIRLASENLPGIQLLQDQKFSLSYGTHLKRWHDALGNERILIAELEELENNIEEFTFCLNKFFAMDYITGEPKKLNKFYSIRFPKLYAIIRNNRVKKILNSAVAKSIILRKVKILVREKIFMRPTIKPESLDSDKEHFLEEYNLAKSIHQYNRNYWRNK